MRLNGWQRIGVVLSVAWAVWAFFYQAGLDGDNESNVFKASYSACRNTPADPQVCVDGAKLEMQKVHDGAKWNPVIAATVPIPFGWIAAYGLLVIVRWIRRGFQQ